MANSAIIEVVIGLIFVYTLLSILVTQINTLIGNALNTRAKRLKQGMVDLLTDPVIRAKIMAHPLIGMVEDKLLPGERITSDKAEAMTADDTKAEVSWVETTTFVDVLTDVLAGGTGHKLYATLNSAVDAMPPSIEKSEIRELIRKIQVSGTGLPELREAIRNLSDEAQRQSLLNALNLVEDALDKLGVESSDLIPLFIGVKQIQDPHLQRALEAVLNTAHSVGDAQEKLGKWFDNNMDRVTELYKRHMQRLSLVIGLVLALVLNVDTLRLAQSLWEDPSLREAVAATAQTVAPQLESDMNSAQTQDGSVDQSFQDVQTTLNDLLDLRLPIGWEIAPVDDAMIAESEASALLPDPLKNARNLWNFVPGNSPHWLGLLIEKLIGLGVTMIAVAQGAPFWFDLLRKLSPK
jgi:hypothetical protein